MNQPFKNLDQGFEPDGRSTRVNDRYDPYSRPLVPEGSSGNLKTMQQGYHICILVLAFINLIVVWMAYGAVSGYSASLNDFKTNWSLKPIVDIKTGLSRCPGGYEDLIIDRWPGTSTGCDCSHAWGFYPNLQTGRCDVNETNDGCRTVSSTASMPLNKFYSYRICAKRQGDPFNRAVRPTKMFGVTKCPGGYKICGSGEPKDQYCVSQGSPCPINSIIISDTSSTFSNTDSQIPQENDDHYTKLNLDSGVVLAFSYSKAGGLPIVRMKLTEGGVCANPEEVGTSKGRYLYKLLRSWDKQL
ncbi:unnamed protein product [Moneuplotes crassus]|uniref:Uncharacterized protein n=1 Tax=Euplotes crassus TaxID=5936 RepID=A0AAD1X5Y9_EUPCR|nr:unnamed protein product [Moneuplotes crassus]